MFSSELDYSEGISRWCFTNFVIERFLLIHINNGRGCDEESHNRTDMVVTGAVPSSLLVAHCFGRVRMNACL